MASAQNGIAVVFGFSGFGVPSDVAISGVGSLYPKNFRFNDEFKLDMVRDGDNEVTTLIASGKLYHARLEFTPRAAIGTNTIANARTSLAPPSPLAAVVLANFPWVTANTLKWAYTGGWGIAFVNDGVATYELNITAHATNDLSAPVT